MRILPSRFFDHLEESPGISVITLNFFSFTAFLSTSSPPTPRAVAPALMKAPAFCRFTPPVGTRRIWGRGPLKA